MFQKLNQVIPLSLDYECDYSHVGVFPHLLHIKGRLKAQYHLIISIAVITVEQYHAFQILLNGGNVTKDKYSSLSQYI